MQKLVPANGIEVDAPAARPNPGLLDAVMSEAHVLAEALSPRAAPTAEAADRLDNTPTFAPSQGMRPGR